ncbi:UDP-N-acetylmuramoylalanine--D-glutamate ligase [Leucobacter sp. 7(1)]|uniref:UDP-N-acetylmuramoyl-L-alanine--D-glutamate ligase n=1 Tax=Leucobacter sp. 7(1) TaxID=1255613 RepID=UPI00097F1063|nr:UDP-N-acetylmuramoyl-L-alanine--D-glutamate ligase [Leucobacter sp. 7(1)]SJN12287.1 UDP-N-acetylmuramoylalanine--D-glutamate ligase [Leucobacter sp. 7(1)]
MRFSDLAGKRLAIWGAGREGTRAYEALAADAASIEIVVTGGGTVPADAPGPVVAGEDAFAALRAADVVVKSPGIPHTSPEFAALRDAGVPVTSLMDLWLNEHGDRVIAVTGTKGKSTTSTLVTHFLGALDVTATLAGNVGIPVSRELSPGLDVAVAEVSSYQAADLTASPRTAVLTSLYPEHLPWHGGYEAYVGDKLNLIAHGAETVVLPALTGELAERARAKVATTTRLVTPAELGITVTDDALHWGEAGTVTSEDTTLRGAHNLMNAALAITAVCVHRDVDPADRPRLLAALRAFAPLAHRLEVIPTTDGRVWVDDSLATAPEAVVAALDTYATSRVVLVAGGADRGLDFAPLLAHLRTSGAQRDTRIVTVGPAGERLRAELGPSYTAGTAGADFADALARARELTGAGDVILLSPGAPSFDEFADYEARAAAFRAAAEASA